MQLLPSFPTFCSIPLSIGLFFIALGSAFIYYGNRASRQAEASEKWPSTIGYVLSAKLWESYHDSEVAPTYEPDIIYEYQLMGTLMRGNRFAFGCLRSRYLAAQAIVDRYKPGSQVTVYYDPQDPSQTVLERQAVGARDFRKAGTIFAAFGFSLVFLIIAGFYLISL